MPSQLVGWHSSFLRASKSGTSSIGSKSKKPSGHFLVFLKNRFSRASLIMPSLRPSDFDRRFIFSANSLRAQIAKVIEISFVKGRQLAELMLNYGADLDFRGSLGDTPLILAVRSNDSDMRQFLTQRGADYNLQNNKGMSARILVELIQRPTPDDETSES